MIVCPGCGGNLKFDIASQKMHCAYCDTFINPTDVTEKEKDAQLGTKSEDMMDVTIYSCPQCGAELMSADNEATSFCSYCGASNILTERVSKAQRPDDVIPFKITKDECKKRYIAKIGKTLFAPKALTNPDHIESFRGIYMPYWSYNVTQKGRGRFDGTTEKREGDYRVITHYDLSIDMDNKYEGISHDASESFADNISESLAPYNTGDIVPFSTAYLSGFYADIADVEPKEYMNQASLMAANDALNNVRKIDEFKQYSISTTGIDDAALIKKTHTEIKDVKRSMFPVWFLSYRSDDNRVAYAAINGQTGKVTADIPIDKKKYLIFSAVFAVVLWLILNMFNTPSLAGILKSGIIGGTVCMLVSTMVALSVLDNSDMVWQVIIGAGAAIALVIGFAVDVMLLILAPPIVAYLIYFFIIKSMEEHKKRGLLSGSFLAIIVIASIIIRKADPAADYWYYVPQVLTAIAVVWNFFDVLYYYNQLMTRPLPQFQKSGGDDNA